MLVHFKQWVGKIMQPIGQAASDDARVLKAVTSTTPPKTFDLEPAERDEC